MKPIVITRVAHAGPEDHRFMGHGALTELLGHETGTGLLALAILGRLVTSDEKQALDAMAVSLTAADPRIWPLKASRIAASYGEMLAGVATGQFAMMGTYMSPRVIGAAARHLSRLRMALGDERDPERFFHPGRLLRLRAAHRAARVDSLPLDQFGAIVGKQRPTCRLQWFLRSF